MTEELLKALGTIGITSGTTALIIYLSVQKFIRSEAANIVNGKIKDHRYECQMQLQKEIGEIKETVARIEGILNGKKN